MGVKINIQIIKDIGVLMGLLTLCVGLWHTMLNFQFIILDNERGLFLRFVGVAIITMFAYLPYYLLYKIIKKMKYKTFGWGVGVGFFVGDFILKLDMIFNFFQIFDFMSMISYSLFFMSVFVVMRISDHFIDKCELNSCVKYILDFHIVKKITSFLLSKNNI